MNIAAIDVDQLVIKFEANEGFYGQECKNTIIPMIIIYIIYLTPGAFFEPLCGRSCIYLIISHGKWILDVHEKTKFQFNNLCTIVFPYVLYLSDYTGNNQQL